MAQVTLTQAEADALIAMDKGKATEDQYAFPGAGGNVVIPLISTNKREDFLLDIYRSRIDLLKGTYQNRARQVVVLVRLDFGGAPHRNPDGQELPCPHLHVYREGFGDKWAIPVPTKQFQDIANGWQTLQDFMTFCHVVNPPTIQMSVFT